MENEKEFINDNTITSGGAAEAGNSETALPEAFETETGDTENEKFESAETVNSEMKAAEKEISETEKDEPEVAETENSEKSAEAAEFFSENQESDAEAPDKRQGLQKFFNAKKGEPLFWVKETLSYILILVIAFFAAVFINMYVFRISKVSGQSMDQTLYDGQTVYLSKLPYIFGTPEYKDIVVLDASKKYEGRTFAYEFTDTIKNNAIVSLFIPENKRSSVTHQYYIKRVIGVPGDTIEIKNNTVYRNGEELIEDYVNPAEVPVYTDGKWVVGDDEILVMGDNRNNSLDGRSFGTIKISCVLGKVLGDY